MLILSPFWKVLPKELFEPDSEGVLCQPVHAEPVLLPRLWRILPTDSNSYCWETQGTAHRGLSSKPKGFCPIFSGARTRGGRWQCWTKSSPPLALPSSLLSRHQPPLLGEQTWGRTTLDGESWGQRKVEWSGFQVGVVTCVLTFEFTYHASQITPPSSSSFHSWWCNV